MDALALLCTLHADGPTTLKRLRRSGCERLDAFAALEATDLAARLDLEPAAARRLLREARHLLERVEDAPQDREEAPENLVRAGAVRAAEPSPVAAAPSAGHGDGDDLRGSERAILGRVLERWRKDDEVEPDAPLPAALAPEPEPAPEPQVRTSQLRVGELDGLDRATIDALAELDVLSLTDLAEGDGVALAAGLGLPFAQVRRMQFLARRSAHIERPPAATAPVPTPARELPPVRLPRPTEASTAPPSPGAVPPAPPAPPAPQRTAASSESGEARELDTPETGGATESKGTVLDWNFEIPPPPTRGPATDEGSSGPFA